MMQFNDGTHDQLGVYLCVWLRATGRVYTYQLYIFKDELRMIVMIWNKKSL